VWVEPCDFAHDARVRVEEPAENPGADEYVSREDRGIKDQVDLMPLRLEKAGERLDAETFAAAVNKDDSHVWRCGEMKKIWTEFGKGKIIITLKEEYVLSL